MATTPGAPSRPGIESHAGDARQLAIDLLAHRLNGGLNNAVMAFELAVAPSRMASVTVGELLSGGLLSAERASRAANLLDVLVSASAPAALLSDEYLSDVFALLLEHAKRSGCDIESAPAVTSLDGVASTAENAARALVAGLAAIAQAGRGRLRAHFVQQGDGPWFNLAIESAPVPKGG